VLLTDGPHTEAVWEAWQAYAAELRTDPARPVRVVRHTPHALLLERAGPPERR